MKGKILKRAVAAALAVLIVSGGVPLQPVADMFGDVAITASAEGETLQHIGGLTVCDDTRSYCEIPYKSDQNGDSTGSEQIYPSSMLESMKGKELYSMTFYSGDDVVTDVKGMQVYLAEVDFTTLKDKFAYAENGVVKLYDNAKHIYRNRY